MSYLYLHCSWFTSLPSFMRFIYCCIRLQAQLWKISFFGPLYTEKNNENNRQLLYFPKFVWVAFLHMWCEVLKLFLLDVVQLFSESLQPIRNIVGSCGHTAKGNTSVSSTNSTTFLKHHRMWGKVLIQVTLHLTCSRPDDRVVTSRCLVGQTKYQGNWQCLWTKSS